MSCSNCYNGCTQITSDQCVRYTGIDVPVLGIKSGDSLSYVEQALVGFLVSTLDGTGIKIDIPQTILCPAVSKNLPNCGDLTAVDLFQTLIKTACDIQQQITDLSNSITVIEDDIAQAEAPYTVPSCMTGVSSTSTTHDFLQAVANRLCAFVTDVQTNYVQISQINTYIAQYLAGQTSTKMYNKMVPFVAYEFYGTINDKFTTEGIGITGSDWEKIYLCNGSNGTPDKRGRVAVGVTDGTMGGAPMNPTVNPASNPTFNPTYTKGGVFGNNGVQLSEAQLPSHKHNNTLTVTIPDHTHSYKRTGDVGTAGPAAIEDGTVINNAEFGAINSASLVPQVNLTNVEAGGGQAHSNVQPGIGCYYIMYIP